MTLLMRTANPDAGGDLMVLPLTKTAETASTVTLSWDPPAACRGYLFYAAGIRVAHTLDPTRSSVKFSKAGAPFRVEALGTLAEGVYP